MPGTCEATGRNSPRYSAGASGFMSYMSMWLGPPPRQTMMTDLLARRAGCPAEAWQRSSSGNVRAPAASPPTRRKLRRDRPSQNGLDWSSWIVSIVWPLPCSAASHHRGRRGFACHLAAESTVGPRPTVPPIDSLAPLACSIASTSQREVLVHDHFLCGGQRARFSNDGGQWLFALRQRQGVTGCRAHSHESESDDARE